MTSVKLPLLPRFANYFCGALNSIGLARVHLSIDSIKHAVSKSVGWSDFGPDCFLDCAQLFIDAFESGANAYYIGRYLLRENLGMLLRKRLQVNKLLQNNEAIRNFVSQKDMDFEQPPVFVLGSPRSGTTLLYNLLALDPNARAPKFWEVLDPAPPASILSQQETEDRILNSENRLAKYKRILPPAFRQIHFIDSVRNYEEDYFLLEPTFRSPSLSFVCGNGTSYRDYLYSLPDADVLAAYEDFATSVRILMYRRDAKKNEHWVSKSPVHSPFAWAIPRVFPKSTIIHTHRDPAERIPSLCSLISIAELLIRPPSRNEDIVDRVLNFNYHSMRGMKRGRDEAESNQATVIDIDYQILKTAPIETVAGIYEKIGFHFSDQYSSVMKNWLQHKNIWDPSKRGAHKYSPEEFGLSRKSLKRLEP